MVANQLHLLHQADAVVVLDRGTIVEQGSFASLMQRPEGVLAQLMDMHGDRAEGGEGQGAHAAGGAKSPSTKVRRLSTGKSKKAVDPPAAASGAGAGANQPVDASGKLVDDEVRDKGNVAWKNYLM